MYGPAFFTAILVSGFGEVPMLAIGIAATEGCALLGLSGTSLPLFWAALTLLGLGWNALFVAATSLLTRTYRPEERFRVETANDVLLFGVMAVASLGAGPLLAAVGWNGLNLISLAMLAGLAAILLLRVRRS